MLEYRCPQRPKESVGSPKAGIAGVSEALEWVMGEEFKLVSSGSTEVLFYKCNIFNKQINILGKIIKYMSKGNFCQDHISETE